MSQALHDYPEVRRSQEMESTDHVGSWEFPAMLQPNLDRPAESNEDQIVQTHFRLDN